jgi:hypothetical protein
MCEACFSTTLHDTRHVARGRKRGNGGTEVRPVFLLRVRIRESCVCGLSQDLGEVHLTSHCIVVGERRGKEERRGRQYVMWCVWYIYTWIYIYLRREAQLDDYMGIDI